MSTAETGRLIFTPRPAPVSPRLRPAHRVALLLEMVAKCHGAKATLLQLHAIDTALTDPARPPVGSPATIRRKPCCR